MMREERLQQALEEIAARQVPETTNLWPRLAARIEERKSLMQTLRARPALALFILLLALALLTGVVYAVGKSLGYLPGVGIIDQSAPIRVLAEPVSVTREGVTITVEQAALTPDQTVVVYTVENVPWEAFSHDENVGGCYATPFLRLSDGSDLQIIEGGGSGIGGQSRYVYSAILADVNEATFNLSCIQGTLPGKAPENWELHLRFVPAPPDMTVIPVIEIQPTQTQSSETATEAASPFVLTQALQVDEQYVLLGNITQPATGWIWLTQSRITDASGREIFASFPMMDGLPPFDWGFQFDAAGVNYPVTLTFTGEKVSVDPSARAEFEFDAGEDPQPGQEWTPNQEILIGGRTLKLLSVQSGQEGYSFDFTGEPDVRGVSLYIAGYTPMGGGGGGGGDGQFSVSVMYETLPKGKLHVVLSNLTLASPPQTWTLQWSPQNPPAAAPLYGISLHLDRFIPLEDGYYLIGHFEWTDERIAGVTEYGTLQAFDANGNEVPIEKIKFAEAVTLVENLEANQWVYHLRSNTFSAPLVLRLSLVNVEFKQPVRFSLDLRSYGFTFAEQQVGMPWKTGLIPLDVPGLGANLFRVTYVHEANKRGFEFALEADPRLQSLALDFEGGVTGETGPRVGESRRDPQSGLLLITVLTDGQLSMPLSMVAYGADVADQWETLWSPPVR